MNATETKTWQGQKTALESKNKKLEIAREVLQKEFDKLCPKYGELDERINSDTSLTEKQFDRLLNKRQAIQDNIEALEYGIGIITESIKHNQYLIRMCD